MQDDFRANYGLKSMIKKFHRNESNVSKYKLLWWSWAVIVIERERAKSCEKKKEIEDVGEKEEIRTWKNQANIQDKAEPTEWK